MGSFRRAWHALWGAFRGVITAHVRAIAITIVSVCAIGYALYVYAPAIAGFLDSAMTGDRTQETKQASVPFTPPTSIIPLDANAIAIRERAILERYRFYVQRMGQRGFVERIRKIRGWRAHVEQYANAAGIDPVRMEAIIAVESAGDSDAESYAGARGLLQVIDSNAWRYGAACGVRVPMVDSYNAEKSVCTGTRYFAELLARYHGDVETAYAGYNWGQTRLDAALAKLPPGVLPSFWSLWDRSDPVTGLPLLLNRGRNPNETREYVPNVLAWEYVLRYHDAHGTPPPVDAQPVSDPLLVATPRVRASDGVVIAPGGATTGSARSGEIIIIVDPPAPEPPPTSSVWYTARAGDDVGRVLALLGADSQAVVALNPDLASHGWQLRAGERVLVPEIAFAFVMATHRETYRDLAHRHRMTTGELLRWSGRWSDAEAWAFAQSASECPSEGCAEERERASRDTKFLVRRH